jgi:hypothetical protein
MTRQQALLYFAELHYVHAIPQDDGIAVFTELCLDGELLPFCEIELATTLGELRAILGY